MSCVIQPAFIHCYRVSECVEHVRNISVHVLALWTLGGGSRRRPFADHQRQTHLRMQSVAAQRVLGAAGRESIRQVRTDLPLFLC